MFYFSFFSLFFFPQNVFTNILTFSYSFSTVPRVPVLLVGLLIFTGVTLGQWILLNFSLSKRDIVDGPEKLCEAENV